MWYRLITYVKYWVRWARLSKDVFLKGHITQYYLDTQKGGSISDLGEKSTSKKPEVKVFLLG